MRVLSTSLVVILVIGFAAGGGAALRAADEGELRQKTEEVERLKRELEQAEKELERLRRDNEQLRQQQKTQERQLREQERVLKQPAAQAPREPKPVRPLSSLAPLAEGAVVEADELVGHYAADPVQAAARYEGKVFRVRGEIASFSSKLVIREFSVVFASAEPSLRVLCRFPYVDKYRAVYPRRDGRELVSRTEAGHERLLLEVGATATFKGKCRGLKDGQIVMTGCEIVE